MQESAKIALQLCWTKRKKMEQKKTKFTNILDTEMFGDEREQYYFDIKKAKNQKHYLRITNRKKERDESYKRIQIILFEEDLAFFVEAITMLLGRHVTGNLGISC
jgi:DNA repair protein RadC